MGEKLFHGNYFTERGSQVGQCHPLTAHLFTSALKATISNTQPLGFFGGCLKHNAHLSEICRKTGFFDPFRAGD